MAKQQQRHIFSRIVIPGVIVLIVLYLIVSAWIGLRDAYPTEVAYTDTMEDSLSANGWVVRSEQPISGGSGLVQLQRDQQEKVGKGQTIAVVYQDEQYVEHQEQLLEAKADLTALQFATYDGSPSGVVLEEQMLTAMTDLRRLASSGNYTTLSDQADTYRKLILRQEFLVSGTAAAEMNAAAAGLYDSYSTLMGYQSGATTITAPASGLFSSHLDGYETLLSPSTFTGIDPTGMAKLDELAPLSEEGTLGKLVTGSDWYYAILVPGDYAAQFVAGNSASIYFDSLSTTLKMTVYSVSEVQRDQAVVVFRSTRDMDKASDLRRESGRVVFRSKTGLRVPKQSLHVQDDGTVGVYVVSGYFARFRPVEILAEDKDTYLVKAAPTSAEDTRILHAGDEIILAAEAVEDGKVIR